MVRQEQPQPPVDQDSQRGFPPQEAQGAAYRGQVVLTESKGTPPHITLQFIEGPLKFSRKALDTLKAREPPVVGRMVKRSVSDL